jgi:hypothetical protein
VVVPYLVFKIFAGTSSTFSCVWQGT